MYRRRFTIGRYAQHTYGLLVAAAFLCGLMVAVRQARREGLDADRVFNLCVYVALVAFAGSRLLLAALSWRYYLQNPRQLFSLESLQVGGIFYGGLLAGIAFAAWYARRSGMSFWKLGDSLAPGIAVGHAIGRLGCFA